jgi:catechol 2,3-dioxygenase-like lactoylglutathione lyase family enzyme
MGRGGTDSLSVAATGINHVSISARNMEESARFYEEIFGMERIPSPDFGQPVCWLQVGDVQLHLLLDRDAAPRNHHLGLTIDDFESAYEAIHARADVTFGWSLVELPSGQVQLYFRDPGGNLIELNWPDVETLDRSKYPELTQLADRIPQSAEALRARLYLRPGEAGSAAAARALPNDMAEARP